MPNQSFTSLSMGKGYSRLLVTWCGRAINTDTFQKLLNHSFSFPSKEIYDLLDLVCRYSQDNPFEDELPQFSLSLLDDLPFRNPVTQIIERNFIINWDSNEFPIFPNTYYENSRLMFRDPKGYGLEAARKKGLEYCLLFDYEALFSRSRYFLTGTPLVVVLLDFISN